MNNPQGTRLLESPFPVEETMNRLVVFLQQQGVTIYTRINQQAELANIDLHIAPIEMLLFESPKNGGPVMAFKPVAALELPLKILAYEDGGKIWIAFNEAEYIGDRYQLPDNLIGPLNLTPVIKKALNLQE